jgi:hypothetical protein
LGGRGVSGWVGSHTPPCSPCAPLAPCRCPSGACPTARARRRPARSPSRSGLGLGSEGGRGLSGVLDQVHWARARRGESCAIAISISPSSEKDAERTKGRALSTLGEPTPNLQLLSWGLPLDTGGPTHAVSDAACPRVESVLVWPRVAWVAPERAPERRAPTWTRIPTGCSCRRRPCPSACAAWPARGGGGAGRGEEEWRGGGGSRR